MLTGKRLWKSILLPFGKLRVPNYSQQATSSCHTSDLNIPSWPALARESTASWALKGNYSYGSRYHAALTVKPSHRAAVVAGAATPAFHASCAAVLKQEGVPPVSLRPAPATIYFREGLTSPDTSSPSLLSSRTFDPRLHMSVSHDGSNFPFHHAALSRRSYSSIAPKSPSTKRKREGAGDKEEGKPAPPKRSELNPPKQAPSVWQIYFLNWLEQKKSNEDGDKKINVAQAAKEAAQQYNKLTDEARDALKLRAVELKDKYERESTAWKRTLTPEDIARENAFRAAQRRSGKSRRKNINDPNAPKRPMGAYFLFLQRVRGDPELLREIFGEETESTRQSVLAAAKWRSMTNLEKQPYFEQAEAAKLEYEADRKVYEEQTKADEYASASPVMVYSTSSDLHDGKSGGDSIVLASGRS